MDTTKQCSKCKETRDITSFAKKATSLSGLQSCCKICNAADRKKYRENNLDKIKARNQEYYKNNSEKIVAKAIKYQENNPEKAKESQARYRQKNLEKAKEYQKEYRENNLDKIKARQREYYKNNSEKVRAYYESNRDEIKAQKREYHQKYPDKINARNARRRAAKLQATPPWLTKDHHDKINFHYEAAMRLERLTQVRFHVDHIIPLRNPKVCGLHVPWNLQVITAEENTSKGNKFVV